MQKLALITSATAWIESFLSDKKHFSLRFPGELNRYFVMRCIDQISSTMIGLIFPSFTENDTFSVLSASSLPTRWMGCCSFHSKTGSDYFTFLTIFMNCLLFSWISLFHSFRSCLNYLLSMTISEFANHVWNSLYLLSESSLITFGIFLPLNGKCGSCYRNLSVGWVVLWFGTLNYSQPELFMWNIFFDSQTDMNLP